MPLFASLIVSCKRDETLDIRNTEYISFKFSDEELSTSGVITKGTCDTLSYEITDWDYTGEESDTEIQTKGTLTERLSDTVGVFAEVGSTTVMSNAKHTVNGSELVPETKVLWKNYTSGTMNVFAYAPYKEGITPGSDDSGKYFSYTVADSISKQEDLLYATAQKTCSTSDRTAIPLAFKHGLTAIQFRMGFECKVKNITISNVKDTGKFYLDGTTPSVFSGKKTYSLTYSEGKVVNKDSIVNKGNGMMILMPQAFDSDDQTISLTYNTGVKDTTISAKLKGTAAWPAGKKVTYTLKKAQADTSEYIYFDFTAGDIILTNTTYKGHIYVNGADSVVTGAHSDENKYYVYQSAPADSVTTGNESIKSPNTGYASVADFQNRRKIKANVPQYQEISVGGKTWGEYITNNTDPAAVLATWNNKSICPENFLEPGTPHRILICGDAKFDITLDRVYSRDYPYRAPKGATGDAKIIYGVQATAPSSKTAAGAETYKELYGGITVGIDKSGLQNTEWHAKDSTKYKTYNEKVTLRLKGNNYFSRINYSKPEKTGTGYMIITSEKGDNIAEGTLTVTFPFLRNEHPEYPGMLNFTRGALLGAGSASGTVDKQTWYYRQVSKLYFKGGIIYVGTEEINGSNWTYNDNMTANIGGTNARNEIEISGGILTSIAYGSQPAIGGGPGWTSGGGDGVVKISGGTVYAYSFGVFNGDPEINTSVMSAAIGGGSSGNKEGNVGTVEISGGTVYAYSLGGCAIGGGTSAIKKGGKGDVTIKGGQVFAKSLSGKIGTLDIDAGVAIGGGRSGIITGNGGDAVVTIEGGTTVAGSIGGGKCGNTSGKLGLAVVEVSGGETSAQFLLVKDKSVATANTFTMKKGVIKNSNTSDTEYKKVQKHGGAVYMESGTCTIKGGTIEKCSADTAGAIYMNGGTFEMKGGEISNCTSDTDGGAVYIEGGSATVSGGELYHNIASKGNGGGIYVSGGNFTMSSGGKGKILNNSADTDPVKKGGTYYGGNGGGIYVHSTDNDVEVKILGGTVQYNAADRNGGGLCVDMSDAGDHKATITIGNEDVAKRDTLSPDIRLNSAALSGGGMAVQGNGSNITIYSGTVKGNVSAFVKNEDIRNDGGTVELVGKNEEGKTPQVNVQYNTITFYANNGNDPEPYDEQRVITSTNSLLQPTAKALAFELEFYHIASWNTKRDGTGTKYTADGKDPDTGRSAIMNITSDVSLYAQWEKN